MHQYRSLSSLFLEPGISADEQMISDCQYSVLCAFNFISCYFAYPHSPFSHFIPVLQSLCTFPCSKFALTVFCATCCMKRWPQIWVSENKIRKKPQYALTGLVIPGTNHGGGVSRVSVAQVIFQVHYLTRNTEER